jgi:hypothetical protein
VGSLVRIKTDLSIQLEFLQKYTLLHVTMLLISSLYSLNVSTLLLKLGKSFVSVFLVLLRGLDHSGVILVQAHKHSGLVEEHLIDLLERTA